LSGEAYFEVAKDERSPFIVSVGEIKIKVHGTHFNVNSYSEKDGVAVTLLEGSIEMITPKSNTILQPGNMARYDAKTGKIALTTNIDLIPVEKLDSVITVKKESVVSKTTEYAIDWINNRLVFNGETFEQIIATLERSYNVKVNIHNDQIRKRRFAGDFTNNETIEQIFTVMSYNGKFRYEIKGNIINLF
jgi:ferric-dicitrate binding protein FerR (iron transport regulator)